MPINHEAFLAARLERRQTRVEVALATGIPVRTLYRIENGTAGNLRVDDMMILSSYLRLDPSETLIHPRRGKPWLTKSRYERLL